MDAIRWDRTLGAPKSVIAVVDDDPEVLRSLIRLFRHEPYDILATEHPEQILHWICERRIDLIIADQRMPEMNGTDLLEIVRDYSPLTGCVILSGFPDTALIVQETGLRLERVLAKPWNNGDLTLTIRRLLEERALRLRESGESLKETPGDLARPPAAREAAVNCAGRRARDVIVEILSISVKAQSDGVRRTVVLENLPLLEDSVARLLKGLARVVARGRFPIDLRDDSGCVPTFLSALGHRAGARP